MKPSHNECIEGKMTEKLHGSLEAIDVQTNGDHPRSNGKRTSGIPRDFLQIRDYGRGGFNPFAGSNCGPYRAPHLSINGFIIDRKAPPSR